MPLTTSCSCQGDVALAAHTSWIIGHQERFRFRCCRCVCMHVFILAPVCVLPSQETPRAFFFCSPNLDNNRCLFYFLSVTFSNFIARTFKRHVHLPLFARTHHQSVSVCHAFYSLFPPWLCLLRYLLVHPDLTLRFAFSDY